MQCQKQITIEAVERSQGGSGLQSRGKVFVESR